MIEKQKARMIYPALCMQEDPHFKISHMRGHDMSN
ncbi:hypothetical protein CWE34_00200 [Bacillus sp. SN10]|nr:hypothetical protein CWE34_00200 [Bacillus sp. SN10]